VVTWTRLGDVLLDAGVRLLDPARPPRLGVLVVALALRSGVSAGRSSCEASGISSGSSALSEVLALCLCVDPHWLPHLLLVPTLSLTINFLST
jgi:hypothetical protein